jgi:alpha-tubulin suppressor-like RCC1 family protein
MSFGIDKYICTKLIKPEEWSSNELICRRIRKAAHCGNCSAIKLSTNEKGNVLCRPKEMYLQKSKVLTNSLLSIHCPP